MLCAVACQRLKALVAGQPHLLRSTLVSVVLQTSHHRSMMLDMWPGTLCTCMWLARRYWVGDLLLRPVLCPAQEPPFRDPKLAPLSPPRSVRWSLTSPPLSPTAQAARHRCVQLCCAIIHVPCSSLSWFSACVTYRCICAPAFVRLTRVSSTFDLPELMELRQFCVREESNSHIQVSCTNKLTEACLQSPVMGVCTSGLH